jgi:uncharacterized membrane protein YidH (DUF202 family)
LLASVFVVVGFGIMIVGLQNYSEITEQLAIEDEPTAISVRLLIAVTVVLELVTISGLILFVLG